MPLDFIGQFHPLLVHFPIVLLMVAAGAEAYSLVFKKPAFQEFAIWTLCLGSVSTLFAAASGWALAATMSVEPELRSTLFWHRWLGTGTAVWGLVSLALWFGHKRTGHALWLLAYRAALVIGALLVSVSGHLGGLLVYGLDYFE